MPIRRQAVAPLALVAAAVVCIAVAVLAGRPVWAAALGAGLVLVYWALEALTWRRVRARRGLALDLAVGGMAVRLAVAIGVLVLVGLVARAAFATTALAFLACFTVYLGVRVFAFSPLSPPAGHPEAHS
ncbi:MAG TPA: hypothetical protein VIL79_13160 [Thermoleophilia bacterium]